MDIILLQGLILKEKRIEEEKGDNQKKCDGHQVRKDVCRESDLFHDGFLEAQNRKEIH